MVVPLLRNLEGFCAREEVTNFANVGATDMLDWYGCLKLAI